MVQYKGGLRVNNLIGKTYFFVDRIERLYFSKKDIAEGYFLYGEKKAYFTDARYFADAKRYFKNTDVVPVLLKGLETVKDFIKGENIKEIFTDFDKISVSEFNELSKVVLVSDGKEFLSKAREIKGKKELSYIKKACKIIQRAYYSAIKEIKLGMTEIELKDILEGYILKYGADGVGFETIVAFGKGSAVPHHVTGKTKLAINTPILIDAGAKYKGYVSDITRVAFFGTPSDEFLRVYDAVLQANLTAEEKITSGIYTDEADKIARDCLEEKGLAKYFTHSLGHGVGLEVHESPTLSPRKKEVLRDGLVFTIEPGVYLDGKFGVRIEDTVVLDDGRVERLFSDNKKLYIIKDKS